MKQILTILLYLILFFTFSVLLFPDEIFSQSVEQSVDQPVVYSGSIQPDNKFFDGKLRHAIGVHTYQAFRANRILAPEGGKIGWTYNHAPFVCYWNNKFYLQYLSNPKEEHVPPGRTLLMSSEDGLNWSKPVVIFPEYQLPEHTWEGYKISNGTYSVMHQRMGFYVSPNGKLLTIGFYSVCPNPRIGPNRGQGPGRVVREIKKDGSLGPIFFIRYQKQNGWNESNTKYPFYKRSKDQEFVAACDSLLNDKLITLQWWEMDRQDDGFFNLKPKHNTKALSYYHRSDGAVVALWKWQYVALSYDNGKTWSEVSITPSILDCGSKTWGQKTEDDKYALVYNHTITRKNRFPLVAITGDDGYLFPEMYCLEGEVPPIRYQGLHKNIGYQYIRGIVEGNGNPPGSDMWLTFGMNKEDIWIARVKVPVSHIAQNHVNENFDRLKSVQDLIDWNIRILKWANVSISKDKLNKKNNVLELTDEEPYDYAKAERVIPNTEKLAIEFQVNQIKVGHSNLDFEIEDELGNRPLRLRFDPDWLSLDIGKNELDPIPFSNNKWYKIILEVDCVKQNYNLYLDDNLLKSNIPFNTRIESVNRIVFRTGPWRGDVRQSIIDGEPETLGLYFEDAPGADFKVPISIYHIDNVKTYSY
ncbi:MAG: hypothetical protein RDU14_13135 [Melioribacteraceae bacterium]|nr:hypothetical protein [Melioribacteraceae bacterium]